MDLRIPLEVENVYKILSENDEEQVYYALQDSGVKQHTCSTHRPFLIRVIDRYGKEVISIYRPFRRFRRILCNDEVRLMLGDDEILGSIKQKMSLLRKHYWDICDEKGVAQYRMKGPCCNCACPGYCSSCFTRVEYKVYARNHGGNQIAKISKAHNAESHGPAYDFTADFPRNLDVKIKAVFIGAVFLIDFMFFIKTKGLKQSIKNKAKQIKEEAKQIKEETIM